MDNSVSMLRLQADLISGESKYLEMAAAVCETNDLPETARNIRLSLTIFKEAVTLIRKEADELEEINQGS